MNIYTIGFTKKSAESFFEFINKNSIKTLIDVRLNNISQLSGFAKKDDLKFFLKELCSTEYIHIPDLAPTKEILTPYQDKKIKWDAYEDLFLNLMAKRNIERTIDKNLLEQGCLLCSEHEPHHCHRRLVVEYLNKNSDLNLKVKHLF
ncbi:DUF488 domain-containing protein [Janthinobacterium lividum]|uniref:DUF488 domain-containing protein n=1 Tax=Janthinobacterium lividum TaxID=29581 RepID=A0ABU0XZE2_9BURK|nr:DUF488 domain-containing protein [Janthinobacterium lividum]MDQ4627786.1 DUF488 domain-containing protein [Janthinobacterium lividum]MDQ4676604.1 DUF488 domain-containing protein [Janthinobacterium lividum]MDQ4686924.1 DUF488 domain-containing protein [Janthinobacterium lividum]